MLLEFPHIQKAVNNMNLIIKKIGNILKIFRKEKGITQVKLVEFLNTTQSTISGL